MIRLFHGLVISLLLSTPLAAQEPVSGSSVQGETVISMIVASIDGEPLTSADISEFARATGEPAPKQMTATDPQAQRLLRELVAQKLISKEAERIGVEVEEGEVDSYVAEIQRQNNVDQSSFENLLKSQGLSVEEYKRQVQSDILRTRVFASEVRSKINITDEDVQRYVDDRPELKPEEGEVRLQQILYKPSGKETGGDARKKLSEIKASIEQGADWETAGGE